MGKKNVFCYFISFIFFMSFFSSCGINNTTTSEMTTITSQDSMTQISVPNGWREAKELYKTKYRRLIEESMKMRVSNSSIIEESEVALDNYNALQFIIDGEVNSIKLTYLVNVVETPKFFHQVIGATSPRKMDKV